MKKPYLVCIDSDGCVFDTMEIKHKECFCPPYIDHFNLQAVSKYARDAWDFANLYSATRGIHRLKALLLALEVLKDRKEVQERDFIPTQLPQLRAYVESGLPLSNAGLEEYLKEHPDKEEIRTTLAWSLEVNERVGKMVHGVPPFPHVRECLSVLKEKADIVIVSATQELALQREWAEHGLLELVTAVKGQESGTKAEIIASLKDDYAPDRVLMIGDAPGDRDAAKANGALFYPICPDREAASWAEFPEVMEAFLEGRYRGACEDEIIARFEKLLPAEPAWEKGTKEIVIGSTVGQKFYLDGSVRRYPGNTVVADVTPECPAYEVMQTVRKMWEESGLAHHYTLLPEDSYHMTVIRGLNHQVRKEGFWPEGLDKNAPMTEVDDYVSAAIAASRLPQGARMRFREIYASRSCVIVKLDPADAEQDRILRSFRDRAAEKIGLYLPKHESYTFHISLAYTLTVPTGEEDTALQALKKRINDYLATAPEFVTSEPYMAYYDDMYAFHPHRIPRD